MALRGRNVNRGGTAAKETRFTRWNRDGEDTTVGDWNGALEYARYSSRRGLEYDCALPTPLTMLLYARMQVPLKDRYSIVGALTPPLLWVGACDSRVPQLPLCVGGA
jgi:hypothetical protein